MSILVIFLLIVSHNMVSAASTSVGDRSIVYQSCLVYCLKDNCASGGSTFSQTSTIRQDFWCAFTGWRCLDECRYSCMWTTVEKFIKYRGFTPKFHGKWPLRRMFGMQDPASVAALLANLCVHIYMTERLRRQFSAKTMNIIFITLVCACISLKTLLWSMATCFEEDAKFPEFVEYTYAFIVDFGMFMGAIVRLFYKRKVLTFILVAPMLLFFVNHVQYLYQENIDYEYTVIVNLFLGVVSSVIWLCWSIISWVLGRRHAWRMLAFMVLSHATMFLKLSDFPPVYNWDPQALCYLTSVPLPLLFVQFVIDDLRWIWRREDLKLKEE